MSGNVDIVKLIEEKLGVFSFGQIQDFVSMFDAMRKRRISEDDIRDYVKKKIEITRERDRKIRGKNKKYQEIWQEKAKRCPHCDIPMRLTPGDSNDSMWTCMKCRYGAYDPRSQQEILKAMGL